MTWLEGTFTSPFLNFVAIAVAPPVGDAPVQLITSLRGHFSSVSAWTEEMRKHNTSSTTAVGGVTSPFVDASIVGKISPSCEKSTLRKAQQKAAFPVQWRRLNSLHLEQVNRPSVILIKLLSLSLPTFRIPLLPSNSPPCIPPESAFTNCFPRLRGKPSESQTSLKRRWFSVISPDSSSSETCFKMVISSKLSK